MRETGRITSITSISSINSLFSLLRSRRSETLQTCLKATLHYHRPLTSLDNTEVYNIVYIIYRRARKFQGVADSLLS